MAAVVDKIKRKNKAGNRDWSASGSFINKPAKGWLHPDEQLAPDAGICYGVRVCVSWKDCPQSSFKFCHTESTQWAVFFELFAAHYTVTSSLTSDFYIHVYIIARVY